MPPQTKPRAKEEDLQDFDDLPFNDDELAELEGLGDLDLDITEDDLLEAAGQMGDSVELELSLDEDEPKQVVMERGPSLSEAALQLLQKEVRDTQVMVAKFGNDLEDFAENIILRLVGALQAGWDGRFTELKTHFDERFRQLSSSMAKTEPVAVQEVAATEATTTGLTEAKQGKLIEWMKRQEKLPSAAATAQGLSDKLGVTVQEMMDFFKEKKLIGRGGSLKKPE